MKMRTIRKAMFAAVGLLAEVAVAGAGTSNEFRLDTRPGVRTAVV